MSILLHRQALSPQAKQHETVALNRNLVQLQLSGIQ